MTLLSLCLIVVVTCGCIFHLEAFHFVKPINMKVLKQMDFKTSNSRLFEKKWSPHQMVGDSFSLNSQTTTTFDFKATCSYIFATLLQWSLIYGSFFGLEKVVLEKVMNKNIRLSLVAFISFVLSLRSRIFSPLDNSRPKATNNDPVFKNRIRPSWQPPPFVFPIVWSTISLLRVISTTLVYQSYGTLLCTPIAAMITHLSIGDTWNTINNVENRLGTAVVGVFFVLLSGAGTTFLYYKTTPLAGYVLFPSVIWLSIASCLIYSIWKLNSSNKNTPSLYPSIEEGPPSSWKIPLISSIIGDKKKN